MNKLSAIENDWRYTGQDKYLSGIKLVYSKFDSGSCDHNHCEFCFAKFSDNIEDLQTGYCSLDRYHWICKDCYSDFKQYFNWELID